MRAFFVPTLIASVFVAGVCRDVRAEAAATQPAQARSADAQDLKATCIQMKGSVEWAPLGTDPKDRDAWKPVELNGKYGSGVKIRTGIRSSALLKFGDDTVVQIGRMTLAAIGEYYKTATTKRTNIGLNYGTVRAGVAETTGLRSDFEIDSPVATLSKRGTWDFELWVERGTGRFRATLAERGLIEILQKRTGRRQRILPGQFVTQAMLNWAATVKFTRQLVLTDAFAQTASELISYFRTNTGRTGLSPAGTPSMGVGTSLTGQFKVQGTRDGLRIPTISLINRPSRPQPQGPRFTGDASFGTGTVFGNFFGR